MKTELDIISDISKRFDKLGIQYMLTGSIAMNYYAQPRMTRDIDVVIIIQAGDAERLVNEFADDYYIDREAIIEAVHHQSIFNLLHMESVIKVDCIIRKSSEYRQVEFLRRKEVRIDDFTTFIVSKEDLILSKLYWAKDSHSEMQLKDVRNIMLTGYDEKYVKMWLEKLGVWNLFKECKT